MAHWDSLAQAQEEEAAKDRTADLSFDHSLESEVVGEVEEGTRSREKRLAS